MAVSFKIHLCGFAAMRMRGAYNATKFAIEELTDTMHWNYWVGGYDFGGAGVIRTAS